MKNNIKSHSGKTIQRGNRPKKTKASMKDGSNDEWAHVTTFEMELAIFLMEKCPKSDLMLADIKDIVWNEEENTLVSRLIFMIGDQNPKTKIDDIMQWMNDAWNNFPHKKLNGLSPREMSERMKYGDDSPKDRPDFYTVFAKDFPESVRLVHHKDDIWEWEFPAAYHSTRAGTASMRLDMEETSGEKEDNQKLGPIREIQRDVAAALADASLRDDPLQFEAAVIMARDAYAHNDPRRALHIMETTIAKARTVFPAEFIQGKDRLPWGHVDNRPFLFSLGEYATLTENIHGTQRAIPLYEELLSLNPNDNQGMRGLLATAYLKTNRLEALLELSAKFPEDMVAELSVGTLLALFKLGRLEEAEKKIGSLQKYSFHIFREILKHEHPQPTLMPGRMQVGGDDEAWLYWQDQGTLWMTTPGARAFLEKQLGKK